MQDVDKRLEILKFISMVQEIYHWINDAFTSYSLCKVFLKVIMKIRKSDIIAGLKSLSQMTEWNEVAETGNIYYLPWERLFYRQT